MRSGTTQWRERGPRSPQKYMNYHLNNYTLYNIKYNF